MADPQLEHGYTRIANEIMEALAEFNIPGEAMRVVLVVIRKTYGFQKREDNISLSQFCLATGMKKPNCSRAIKKALAMNLIIRTDNGRSSKYRLNKNFEEWKPLSNEIILSTRIKGIIHTDNGSLSGRIPTKDNKDTLTKKINSQGLITNKETKTPPESEKLKIAVLCVELKDLNHGFNPYVFVQKNIKAKIPYQVTIHVLDRMSKHKVTIRDGWAYAIDLLKKEYSNFNYAEELKRHHELKNMDASGFFRTLNGSSESPGSEKPC